MKSFGALNEPTLSIAWATRRNQLLRTTGVAFISETVSVTDLDLARQIGLQLKAEFRGAPAAFGKVALINTVHNSVGLFQLKGAGVEMVHCGNGITAAAAALSLCTNGWNRSIRIEHPTSPIRVAAKVTELPNNYLVQTSWCLNAHAVRIEGAFGSDGGWACVEGVNRYLINIVRDFPAEIPLTRNCGEKFCFVEVNGPLPRVRVASCGRWHGALPQTGAVALAMARHTLPFVASAIPTGVVEHPGGLEELPACTWEHDVISIEMPQTHVEFAPPEMIP